MVLSKRAGGRKSPASSGNDLYAPNKPEKRTAPLHRHRSAYRNVANCSRHRQRCHSRCVVAPPGSRQVLNWK